MRHPGRGYRPVGLSRHPKKSDQEFTAAGATIAFPQGDYIGLDPYAIVCRIWPARPELMLVAIPLITA
ncbi:hypothetical protein NIBR502774_19670 (plasmid) [Rhizobium sp. NIBRBAC000502774]|nr:hypothetical protein NIBR502774_19670 [Rhizobium sp. NIBRBAC000502774]